MEEKTTTTSTTRSILDHILVMDAPYEVVNLEDFDIVLTDMHRDVIRTLEIDGVKHLSLADSTCFPPFDTERTTMKGVTFGEQDRVLVRAVLSSRGKFVNAIMLVDTASPFTFLTEETFKALGINRQDQSIASPCIVINGRPLCVHESKGHFKEVDVLGTDFLAFGELCVNYPNKTATITLPAL